MQYQAAISTRTLLYNHIQKTWKILIEDIAGDHYWLNKEQWNYLWKQFQMTGLPMYLIMDKAKIGGFSFKAVFRLCNFQLEFLKVEFCFR